MILEIIQIFSAHPFILTALACFFCVSVSSANISAVSTFIPSAVLCFCGIVGAAAVSYRSPKKSKKPVMVYLSGTAVAFSLIFAFMLTESSRESEYVNTQIMDDVRHLMETLPATQREVVYMRYYQELSFKEIAELTGVSINTSLGRMRYALINMRRMAKQHQILLDMEL